MLPAGACWTVMAEERHRLRGRSELGVVAGWLVTAATLAVALLSDGALRIAQQTRIDLEDLRKASTQRGRQLRLSCHDPPQLLARGPGPLCQDALAHAPLDAEELDPFAEGGKLRHANGVEFRAVVVG